MPKSMCSSALSMLKLRGKTRRQWNAIKDLSRKGSSWTSLRDNGKLQKPSQEMKVSQTYHMQLNVGRLDASNTSALAKRLTASCKVTT